MTVRTGCSPLSARYRGSRVYVDHSTLARWPRPRQPTSPGPIGWSPLDRLANARLYLCTDARRERGDLADFAEAVLAGGVDIIQLRDKGSPGERRFGPSRHARSWKRWRCSPTSHDRHGSLLAVNDRADIACVAGADVLHLGQDDLPPPAARDIVGAGPLLGRSTHEVAQLRDAAQDAEVDYFCVGPCWPTPTKPGRPAPGLDLVRVDRRVARAKPWFAIGGIDERRLPAVLAAGATRVVVVRAITADEDPGAMTRPSGGGVASSGLAAATARSRCQLAANPGCSGRSSTSSSATQRSSELSRLGTVTSRWDASAITVV